MVASRTGDEDGKAYSAAGLESEVRGGQSLWEISLIGDDYQDDGRRYALTLNQTHHFRVVLETREERYCAWVDGQTLALNVSFDQNTADDFYSLGLGSFQGSEVVVGFDNIVIKGLPGPCLPGINLLLLE